MDRLDLLAVQGTLKSLLQHHSSKAPILWCSAFFTVQLSHPYMTTGKTIALTRQTLVGKVMSLLLGINRVDTLCKEVCHEQDRNGPCPHGAHIHPPSAKMQSAADPPPAPSALRAKPTLRGQNIQSPNVNTEKFHRTVCRVSGVWLIAV